MRSLWKGSITFGLVNIPVKMYTASKEREFKFTLLHKKDLSEIRYARMCKAEEKEVPWNDIVKGYEYGKGEYLVFTNEELEKMNLDKTKSIEIIGFAKENEIDTVYYAKPYYLEPEKNAHSAYKLLEEALLKSKKVGIAKYVIHNREHLAVIKPYEGMIVLNQLRYPEELVEADFIKLPQKKEKVSAKELSIALKLIDHLTKKFNPKDYHDNYAKDVKKLIEQKSKGRKLKSKEVEKTPSPKVHDIMSLLKASLEKPKRLRKAA